MSQDLDEKYQNRAITIKKNDATFRFFVLNRSVQESIRENLTYYWYMAGDIHHNEEGYSGLLLNGRYEKYDLDGNLLRSGFFKRGLKDGLWKEWDARGNLIRETLWKKGARKHRTEYSKTGDVLIRMNYKNDSKHGKCLVQERGKDTVKYFKNGEVYKPFFIKIRKKLFDNTTK